MDPVVDEVEDFGATLLAWLQQQQGELAELMEALFSTEPQALGAHSARDVSRATMVLNARLETAVFPDAAADGTRGGVDPELSSSSPSAARRQNPVKQSLSSYPTVLMLSIGIAFCSGVAVTHVARRKLAHRPL